MHATFKSIYDPTIKYMYINPLTHLTFVQNEVTCIYTYLCKICFRTISSSKSFLANSFLVTISV